MSLRGNLFAFVAALGAAAFFAHPAFAQDAEAEAPVDVPAPVEKEVPEAASLDQLLMMVKEGWTADRKQNREREAIFKRNKAEQQKLLNDAKAVLAKAEGLSERLEARFQENEVALAELEETYTKRIGSLGELFGVVRQVGGDARGHIDGSLVSAELGGDRAEFLGDLGQSKELPRIAALERLWLELSREMTEQGKIVRFNAPVLTLGGAEEQREVIRAGVFAAVSNGQYILWEPGVGKLIELARQPPARYLDTAGSFGSVTGGMGQLAIDPSKGSLLSLLVDTPSAGERVAQGGAVGNVIIVLGSIAAVIAFWRYAVLFINSRKVAAQRKSDTPNEGNPLGRVLAVYENNQDVDAETLELKLDEAVMKETAFLERFIWLVKVVSVVAPLLGLLGTVTGMIQTFQAITLFGAGDPKMMAGGISQALVTTMLGLIAAIPLVLLHALVANSAKRIIDILDEQSAGMIAQRSEQ
jgi:biopolymer transport protein ExbB